MPAIGVPMYKYSQDIEKPYIHVKENETVGLWLSLNKLSRLVNSLQYSVVAACRV